VCEQQASDIQMALLRCCMQTSPTGVIGGRVRCTNQIGILSEQRADGLDIAASAGIEERSAVAGKPPIHFGL